MNQHESVNSNDPVFSLMDMILYVVHHWRSLLSAALVGLLLVGVLTGVSYWKESKTSPDATSEIQENADHEIQFLEQSIKNQQLYLDESIKMKVDPMAYYATTLSFYIDTDYQILPDMAYQNTDTAPLILQAYVDQLGGQGVMDKLASEIGIPLWAFDEVTSITSDSSHLLEVYVFYDNEETCKQIAEGFQREINQFHQTVVESIGPHEVSLLSDATVFSSNRWLADGQYSAYERLDELTERLDELQSSLPAKASFSVSPKKCVLIFLAIIFLTAAYHVIYFFVSRKIYSAREFSKNCSLRLLGNLASGSKMNPVDRWLQKLENRPVEAKDDAYALVSANIRLDCSNASELLVTGNARMPSALCQTVTEKLQEHLPDVKLNYAGSLQKDAACVSSLSNCDGVILLEQCHVSDYSALDVEAQRVHEAKVPIVGCILLEC